MSELLTIIEKKNIERQNIQEKIQRANNIEEKEELIIRLNNLIDEKLDLSKIYDKYNNNQNLDCKTIKRKTYDNESERKSLDNLPAKIRMVKKKFQINK